jgi:hypothetical protein
VNSENQEGSGRRQGWRRFEEVLLSALLVFVFMRMFRSQRVAEIDQRTRGPKEEVLPKAQRRRSWSAKFQLPSIIAVGIGLGLCACSLWIRVSDSKYPQVREYALEDQRMGVYSDLTSRIALSLPLEKNPGAHLPEPTWTMKLDPGKKVRATFRNVLLDSPGLQRLIINDEVRVVFTLPPGANMIDNKQPLRTNSKGTCASWYDGKSVHYAFPSIQRSGFGSLVVTCTIPPIGQVQDLFFDITFEWVDRTYAEGSYGRYVGGVRLDYLVSTPSDIYLPPPRGLSTDVLMPLEFVLAIPDGERLVESFPSPSGGRIGERKWVVGDGQDVDIEYSIERPSDRAWIQPAVDLTLLLGGVAIGLAPAFRRPTRAEN